MVLSSPKPLATTYHWFFTDIVASAEPSRTADEQARKIVALNSLIRKTKVFKKVNHDSIFILPTGDGVVIGFKDSPENPFLLSLQLHELLYQYNKGKGEKDKISIRIGLNTGPVYDIVDLNGKPNVWGPGIIMARRIMDLAKGMNILASEGFASDIQKLKRDYKKYLHSVGKYPVKHGEEIEVYNIYGGGIGNSKAPPKPREQEENVIMKNPVLFNNIVLELEIKDPKTMRTHHTLLWDFINTSDHEIDRLFYFLDGDAPRDFSDLHVKVKDETRKALEIMSLDQNKPYHKEFFVLLRKRIKRQKRGLVKLEYDWEEIDKRFHYRFASDCKKFKFILRAPKVLSINQRIIRVNMATGEKVRVESPPVVRYLSDKTEVIWSQKNLHANDEYRFDW